MEQDHYGVLELESGSPMEDVKSQYRRLAKLCHPDLHGDDARCAEQFRRVNAAYTFLSDAPRKAAYDAVLQAARAAGAPPLRVAPPPKSAPSPTAPGFQGGPGGDLRMTRSAWLGATAGAVVVLLVIGLSLDGSGPARRATVGVASPFSPGSASANTAGGAPPPAAGTEPGGTETGADADPSADSPVIPPAAPGTDPAPAPPPSRVPVGVASLAVPVRPATEGGAQTDPVGALKRRLLAQSQAVLPRTDRPLGRGYAVRAEVPDTEGGTRRVLQGRLALDLADLSTVYHHLRPVLARHSGQATPGEMHQEAGRLRTDLGRLEYAAKLKDAAKPVRDEIKALASVPSAPRFSPSAPTRPDSDSPLPTSRAAPTPVMASAAPNPPKPSETPPSLPAPNPPVKATAQAASGQEFIRWGK